MITAIPQVLNGIRYRSRTEARWAYFFDLAGIEYEYESEGFDLDGIWYVPDFWLPKARVFFEIKGPEIDAEAHAKASSLANQSHIPVAVTAGNPSCDSIIAVFAAIHYVWNAKIVPEFKGDGAWLAEFVDGGGRALPLRHDLKNCSASGETHPALVEAGRLQFSAPMSAVPDTGLRPVGEYALELVNRLGGRRGALPTLRRRDLN